MPLPALASVAIPAAANFITSLFGNSNAKKREELQRQHELEMQRRSQEADQLAQTRSLQMADSQLDPWRDTVTQGNHLLRLNNLKRGRRMIDPKTGRMTHAAPDPDMLALLSTLDATIRAREGQTSGMTPAQPGQRGIDLTRRTRQPLDDPWGA